MYATDFLFDTKKLSDFGYIICSFDGEIATATGGEIEFNVVKSPNKDRYSFYGSQFNNVLVWNYSICKNQCVNDTMYPDQYDEDMLADWLLKTDGYRPLQFDQEGYEDVCYFVKVDMLPHQVDGRTVGFDLTVTSNCGYGFSQEHKKKFVINKDKSYEVFVHNSLNIVSYPHITISGSGDFYISNDSDTMQNISNDKASEFTNISGTITMDSENDVILDVPTPNDFNWYFMRLVNGNNKLTTNSESDINIVMTYREARRVIV